MADPDGNWSRGKSRALKSLNTVRRLQGRLQSAPTVSVIINTLNRCDYLQRTLLALRAQTYSSFEVIVVNGPSVDGTQAMLSCFQDSARLANCDQPCLGHSRNIGVKTAAGEIVAFLDDDAIPRSDWLEALVVQYRDRRVAAAGSWVFDIPLGRVDWMLCTCTRLGVVETNSPGAIQRYTGTDADPLGYLPGCSMSFRREVLDEVGGFNSLLTYNYDDVEICSRVIDRGYQLQLVEDALVRHHRAPNAARDGHGFQDPYPTLYCRAVFAMQCRHQVHQPEEVIAAVRAVSDGMVEWANHQLAQGVIQQTEHATFVDRTQRGADDGLKAGSSPRPIVTFERADTELFHRYV